MNVRPPLAIPSGKTGAEKDNNPYYFHHHLIFGVTTLEPQLWLCRPGSSHFMSGKVFSLSVWKRFTVAEAPSPRFNQSRAPLMMAEPMAGSLCAQSLKALVFAGGRRADCKPPALHSAATACAGVLFTLALDHLIFICSLLRGKELPSSFSL